LQYIHAQTISSLLSFSQPQHHKPFVFQLLYSKTRGREFWNISPLTSFLIIVGFEMV